MKKQKNAQQQEIKTDEYGFEIYEGENTPQNEIIEDEDFNEDVPEDELEDEGTESYEEDEETEPSEKSEPEEETLKPFAKIIKAYLEEEAKTDKDLEKTLDTSVHACNLCNQWIEDFVKEGIKNKSGCQVGVLSDEDGYRMMKEFFTDGVYVAKLEEEKEKKEKAEKDAKLRAAKEEKKRQAEEEKKKKEEAEKKREEEWKRFMESGETNLSAAEIERERYKHLKQQDLFEF